MKVISFFSRLAIICNVAFLLFIFLGKMEAKKPVSQNINAVAPVSFVKDIIITLGVSSITINLLMCIVYSIIVIIGRYKLLPKWLATVNFLFLIFQFFYFFSR